MPRWWHFGLRAKQSPPALHAATCCCALLWWTRWCKKSESSAGGYPVKKKRSSSLSVRKELNATDEEQGCLVKEEAQEQEQLQLQYEQEEQQEGDNPSQPPDPLLPPTHRTDHHPISNGIPPESTQTGLLASSSASSADPDHSFQIRRTGSTYCCWSPGFITIRSSRSKLGLAHNMPFRLKLSKDSIKGAEQVTHFCRLLHQHQPLPDSMGDDQLPPQKPLSDSQKLRKVILELIDTERCYVKDLNCLIERYLEPLKEETFLSGEDTQQLFGNIQEIVQFQHLFLQSLEEAVQLEPNFTNLSEPKQFRRILFSLGGSFLHYANHFKLYSSFCASHSKAQKVLNPDTNAELREFLRARNPKQQHSSTLESYLIKPIQRILKYPLLLQQLKYLTDPHTDEHHHLSEALRGMEAVAEHINEMQKIYEEYGSIFDDLIRQYRDYNPQKRGIDLNVGDLQMYGTVSWLNALDEIGKIKKGIDLVCTLFVFKSGVVLLAQERIKGKKKPKPQGNKQQSSPESGDTMRYQTVVPVDQLQVRSSGTHDTHHHGFWELVHCKSETEGRPEKTFQLASSLGAKNDFMKTIRNIIRESVRRMSLPTTRVQVQNKPQPPHRSFPQQQQSKQQNEQQHFLTQTGPMLPQHGTKRPDNLPGANKMGGPWTMDKKTRGKQLKSDMVRHSVDMDDRVNAAADTNGDLRTRSRTFSDLNVQLVGGSGDSLDGYPSGSQSTLSSDRGAKLLHASNRPENYNSNSNLPVKDSLGSPIWKPRHYQQLPPHHHHHHQQQQQQHHHHHPHPQQQQQQVTQQQQQHRKPQLQKSPHSVDERSLEAAIFSGSAYGDYSNVVYDEGHGAVLLPNTYVEHEDTEC